MKSIDEKELSKLRSSAGSWNMIEQFFDNNKDIQKYYQEAREECRRDNCFGVATMMVIAMEKMLERIEDLEDDVRWYEEKAKK